jgi:hypothetical protein
MAKYLQFLLQSTDATNGAVSRKILSDTMAASNFLNTFPDFQPQNPVIYGISSYGLGWKQSVYRGTFDRRDL